MKIRLIFIISLLFDITSARAQDTLASPDLNNYLLELNIPHDWGVTRQVEGKDYTLSAYSPDDKLFIYYCQFMNDEKARPKRYFETYTHQLGIDNKPKVVSRQVKGKKVKFYYSFGEGFLMDEKYKIAFFATNIERKNVIAYLVYQLNSNEEVDKQVKKIMLFEEQNRK